MCCAQSVDDWEHNNCAFPTQRHDATLPSKLTSDSRKPTE